MSNMPSSFFKTCNVCKKERLNIKHCEYCWQQCCLSCLNAIRENHFSTDEPWERDTYNKICKLCDKILHEEYYPQINEIMEEADKKLGELEEDFRKRVKHSG
jgi:hypothetical protein